MSDNASKFDENLEREIRLHLEHYLEEYKKAPDKGKRDAFEYRLHNGNLVLDRDLVTSYLTLRAAVSVRLCF
jgi:hypothetical protein